MTYDGISKEPDQTRAILNSDENTQPAAESAEEHMRTIGRILYDIIQDWRHAQDKLNMTSPRQSEVHQLDVFEGRQP